MIKVGLVLSGGGARGLTQIGILKILKKNEIQIDVIAGTSMGAVIGACYAFDKNPEKIEDLLVKIVSKKWDYYDYTFSTKGFIKGEKLEKSLTDYFSDKKKTLEFEDLNIPILINATDIVKGEEVVFDKGPLIPAVMASLSYPGFFTMRKISNKLYVDGGVVNPLPISLISDADYLILLDVSEENKNITENSNMKDVVLQASLVMQKTIVEKSIANYTRRHILIRPNVSHMGLFDFDRPKELIALGEKEALINIEQIKKDILEIEELKKQGKIDYI